MKFKKGDNVIYSKNIIRGGYWVKGERYVIDSCYGHHFGSYVYNIVGHPKHVIYEDTITLIPKSNTIVKHIRKHKI